MKPDQNPAWNTIATGLLSGIVAWRGHSDSLLINQL